MQLRDVMSAPVTTVPDTAAVSAAAEILVDSGFTALPVVDLDGALIGIVTEADLLRDQIPPDPRVHGRRIRAPLPPMTVAEVMTTPVESLTPAADAADATLMMLDERIRCIPVVDGHAIVGIVTRRDLLRAGVVRSDSVLLDEVSRQLEELDNSGRWVVSVQAGVVDVEDLSSDPSEREIARRLAEAVPGVVSVGVRHRTPDPF